MQTIVTKYHGPSNTRGSYISAQAKGGSARVPYASELDSDENHEAAAVVLIKKMNWEYLVRDRGYGIAHGTLPNGDHVHVFYSKAR